MIANLTWNRYLKGGQVLQEFQDATLNKGKLSETIEGYVKYIRTNNQLFIDTSLSKRIEVQRDEIVAKSSDKIKSSIKEVKNK